MLRAIENTSLADQVFEQLTGEIVSGRLAPGATIPSERALSDLFAVNRHVVREATKRLEQVGLVKVVQGGGTTVLDFRHTAGLDLLAVVAEHADPSDPFLGLLAGALEMRVGIGVDLVRLCAERAGADIREELPALADRLAEATGSDIFALDERFWQRILDGAGNLAYQLAFNSLIRAVHAMPDRSLPWLQDELSRGDHRRPIAAAIAAGDTLAAAAAARTALTPAPAAFALLTKTTNAATG
jgi:DNA-binding FadR family transcriptional regulator